MEHFDRARAIHGGGGDARAEQRAAAVARLASFGKEVLAVRIDCADACSVCKPLDGAIMSLAAARKRVPVPHPECASRHNGVAGWCRCSYTPLTVGGVDDEIPGVVGD